MKIRCPLTPLETAAATRRSRIGRALLVALASTALGASPAAAYSSGIAGYAGAPDDPSGSSFTCALCHYGGSLTGGAFLLIPGEIVAGETVPIDVYYSGAAPQVWGFDLIAIEDATGLPIGQLIAGTGTQIVTSAGQAWDYLAHASDGTSSRIGTAANPGWEVEWTAPPSAVDDVTFYLALNAADHSGSTSGDIIFTTTETITVPAPERSLGLALASLALCGIARRRSPGLETTASRSLVRLTRPASPAT